MGLVGVLVLVSGALTRLRPRLSAPKVSGTLSPASSSCFLSADAFSHEAKVTWCSGHGDGSESGHLGWGLHHPMFDLLLFARLHQSAWAVGGNPCKCSP